MTNHQQLEQRYSKLFKDGKLVQIHVRKWGMSAQLDQEDLELKEEFKLPDIFKLGKKMLIKGEELAKFTSIEQKARTYLKNNSLSFPIAQAHFVPRKKLLTVINKLNEMKAEYDALTEEFIQNYPTYKEEMLKTYTEHREKLEPFYPTAERIRQKFGFELSIFEVALPKRFKETDLLEIMAQNAAVEDLKGKYEREMEQQYIKGVQNIDSFLKETITALRAEIVRVFELVSNKIKNREVISKTNLSSIKNIIDNFKELDFLDDKEVNSKLDAVLELIDSNNEIAFKSNYAVVKRLEASLNEALDVARNLSDVDNVTGEYFRKIEV